MATKTAAKPKRAAAAKPAKRAKAEPPADPQAEPSRKPGRKPKEVRSDLKATLPDTPPRKTHQEKKAALKQPDGPVLRGLRTVIYPVADLAKAKEFYIALTGKGPYFDQPFYVGFDVNGSELGLDPDTSVHAPGKSGAVAFWRVDDVSATYAAAYAAGAEKVEDPHDVGGGIRTGIVADPFGNLIGLIEMP